MCIKRKTLQFRTRGSTQHTEIIELEEVQWLLSDSRLERAELVSCWTKKRAPQQQTGHTIHWLEVRLIEHETHSVIPIYGRHYCGYCFDPDRLLCVIPAPVKDTRLTVCSCSGSSLGSLGIKGPPEMGYQPAARLQTSLSQQEEHKF